MVTGPQRDRSSLPVDVLILRVWTEECAGRRVFRAALRDSRGADRRLFTSLDEVLLYLRDVLAHEVP